MDTYEVYREPSIKVEARWAGRDDMPDRQIDSYRRRSPGKIFSVASFTHNQKHHRGSYATAA